MSESDCVAPSLVIRRLPSPAAAASALADAVAADLSQAIAERGRATLAVGGGTTPAAFLRELGERNLLWPKVRVTLTDERWVPAGHPRANATLIETTLLAGAARDCVWQPLYSPGDDRATGLAALNARLAEFGWPLDVAVLGMGEDGHVASLFPDARPWHAPVDAHVVAADSPTGEQRVSLTLDTLRAARQRYLLVHGAAKRAVLDEAESTSLPVGALLAGAASPVMAYTAAETA